MKFLKCKVCKCDEREGADFDEDVCTTICVDCYKVQREKADMNSPKNYSKLLDTFCKDMVHLLKRKDSTEVINELTSDDLIEGMAEWKYLKERFSDLIALSESEEIRKASIDYIGQKYGVKFNKLLMAKGVLSFSDGMRCRGGDIKVPNLNKRIYQITIYDKPYTRQEYKKEMARELARS